MRCDEQHRCSGLYDLERLSVSLYYDYALYFECPTFLLSCVVLKDEHLDLNLLATGTTQ